jgi:nicotinamide-nucleotide amidase
MRAAILSVGSEILRGDIVDTNAAYLARELSELGFDVVGTLAAGDDLARLTDAVTCSLEAADVLVVTGGLGPTEDDLTRDAIAAALGEEITVDPALVEEIERRFARLGRRHVPASNRRQAQVIPSAQPVPNPNGTAPGWLVRASGKTVAAMPGPPSEMQPMWTDSIRPEIESLIPGHVAMTALMTFGVGESALEELVADVIHWRPEVTVATYAKETGVQVHITARAGSDADARVLADQAGEMARARLSTAVFGVGDTTLAAAVCSLCAECGATVGVMESATGGAVGAFLTSTPGSSDYFRGDIVAYSPEIKIRYGVDAEVVERHGVVSPETAAAMAAAARKALNATAGVGLTGVAGTESVEGRPPGTCFIAVDVDGRVRSAEIHRPGTREVSQRYFAQSALNLLRLSLMKAEANS